MSAARRSASAPPMARLRLATRSLRNARIESVASGAVSMDRTRALVSRGQGCEPDWNSVSIRDALDRLPDRARDDSVAFNSMGDNQARLEDIGQGRVEAMEAAGIDVSILSVVTPATQALPAREAIALARDANDEATSAVRARTRIACARSRPCRPATRRPPPRNSNGAPPSWATSAP
jgi:hypothetical protein